MHIKAIYMIKTECKQTLINTSIRRGGSRGNIRQTTHSSPLGASDFSIFRSTDSVERSSVESWHPPHTTLPHADLSKSKETKMHKCSKVIVL